MSTTVNKDVNNQRVFVKLADVTRLAQEYAIREGQVYKHVPGSSGQSEFTAYTAGMCRVITELGLPIPKLLGVSQYQQILRDGTVPSASDNGQGQVDI